MIGLGSWETEHLAAWAGAIVALLVIFWLAGGHLFAFGIGVLVGLIIAYQFARRYLAGIIG